MSPDLSLPLPHLVVLLVALARLLELAWSRRNERWLRAQGAVETGARHYPLFVLLHGGWLVSLLVLADPAGPVRWDALAAFLAVQPVRLWVIVSLGRYWTTRVLSLPGRPLVRRGPYRWLRHPNYAVVVAEIALLPLAFGLWQAAVVFSLLNGLLLWHRIRIEEAALAPRRSLPAGPRSAAPDDDL